MSGPPFATLLNHVFHLDLQICIEYIHKYPTIESAMDRMNEMNAKIFNREKVIISMMVRLGELMESLVKIHGESDECNKVIDEYSFMLEEVSVLNDSLQRDFEKRDIVGALIEQMRRQKVLEQV